MPTRNSAGGEESYVEEVGIVYHVYDRLPPLGDKHQCAYAASIQAIHPKADVLFPGMRTQMSDLRLLWCNDPGPVKSMDHDRKGNG